ncbi:PIN domain-containing protein [Janthinobacterium sp. 64]|uniref:PIN domain-containing protein n=1 Tax=Janthinobacterium sp. 64 TaxID=2035208 RepID=UPI0018E1E3C5
MARIHLFVDTNVFLTFYSYTKDDLGQLKKLIENLGDDRIQLHLPQQVLNELERNREPKLKASADQFKKRKLPDLDPAPHARQPPRCNLFCCGGLSS